MSRKTEVFSACPKTIFKTEFNPDLKITKKNHKHEIVFLFFSGPAWFRWRNRFRFLGSFGFSANNGFLAIRFQFQFAFQVGQQKSPTRFFKQTMKIICRPSSIFFGSPFLCRIFLFSVSLNPCFQSWPKLKIPASLFSGFFSQVFCFGQARSNHNSPIPISKQFYFKEQFIFSCPGLKPVQSDFK